jgi:hypothetical protein
MRFPKWPRWVWRCYAATFAAVAAFVVCSLLPMWNVMQFVGSGWCGAVDIDHHSLWGMLGGEKPGDYSDGIHHRVVIWEWQTPGVITAVSVHIAAIAGVVLGGVPWRKGNGPHPPSPSP